MLKVKKALALGLVLLGVGSLVGCDGVNGGTKTVIKDRFLATGNEYDYGYGLLYEIYDTQTLNIYLINGQSALKGMTPLYDSEGKIAKYTGQ